MVRDPSDVARADQGAVAGQHAVLLQALDPAQAGRGRQRDPVGQFGVGEAAVLLQQADQGDIDGVEVELLLRIHALFHEGSSKS